MLSVARLHAIVACRIDGLDDKTDTKDSNDVPLLLSGRGNVVESLTNHLLTAKRKAHRVGRKHCPFSVRLSAVFHPR